MFINIHTHHLSNSSSNILAIYNQYPWDFIDNEATYSIGIHPVFINQSNLKQDLAFIKEHIQYEKCIAIGEIGLDKLCAIDFDVQIAIFKQQLQIAEENKIPVIIHCVRSYQEILAIRKEMKLTIPFLFHGFNKNEKLLNQITKNQCIPSFGKNLLYNPNLQTIFANLSENEFFLENDGSQIPIEEIYQKAAELKNTTLSQIEAIIKENYNRIFKQSV